MMASMLGAKEVILTEQPELIKFIKRNVRENAGLMGNVCAESLFWARENALKIRGESLPFDFVVCSDCIYEPFWGDSYKLLVDSIIALSDEHTVVLISLERRTADGVESFLAYAESQGLECRLVKESEPMKMYRFMFKLP